MHCITHTASPTLSHPHTCTRGFEGDLALLCFVVSNKDVSEEIGGGGPFVRVRLKAAQNKRLCLHRQGLWDLWVDLKHTHL